jgi:hypothetical protein
MYVERIPNRNSPPAILLRESYRDGGKIKKRTLANLSDWPAAKIEALRRVLRGEAVAASDPKALTLLRSLPHGHVAAALGTLHKLGLDRLLAQGGRQPKRETALCTAMIVARLVDHCSKLATSRLLDDETATCSLGQVLGLGSVDQRELYEALDWLIGQQERIEAALARRHLKNGMLVLYDVSSTYFEGRTCALAKFGYNRDGKKGKLQIVFGLLCTAEGCPVAVEVFEGNVGDPSTLQSQITKLKRRFDLDRVVLVGDRGMITAARLEETIKPAGLDWITALRAPAVRALAEAGTLQLSLFDKRDLAEITSPDYPGERLMVCRNPLLADERARKRGELLDATERKLHGIQARVRRDKKPLRGKDKIGLAVGADLNHYKMAKHFVVTITDDDLTFARNTTQIDAEAALDGVYVLRTSLAPEALDATATVKALQTTRRRRARLPQHQDHRSRGATDSSSTVRSRAGPCPVVHARLLSRMGTCARRSSRSCSTITIRRPPKPLAAPSSPKPSAPKPHIARPPPNAPTTGCRSTASARCSTISRPSPATQWRWRKTRTPPSCSIRNSRKSRHVPSSSSTSPSSRSQYQTSRRPNP